MGLMSGSNHSRSKGGLANHRHVVKSSGTVGMTAPGNDELTEQSDKTVIQDGFLQVDV